MTNVFPIGFEFIFCSENEFKISLLQNEMFTNIWTQESELLMNYNDLFFSSDIQKPRAGSVGHTREATVERSVAEPEPQWVSRGDREHTVGRQRAQPQSDECWLQRQTLLKAQQLSSVASVLQSLSRHPNACVGVSPHTSHFGIT